MGCPGYTGLIAGTQGLLGRTHLYFQEEGCVTWAVSLLYAKVCACVPSHFSCVKLFATLWIVAHQAPLSIGFSRQKYWSWLPCPSPGHLPNPGIESRLLTSPALTGRFVTTGATWEAQERGHVIVKGKGRASPGADAGQIGQGKTSQDRGHGGRSTGKDGQARVNERRWGSTR